MSAHIANIFRPLAFGIMLLFGLVAPAFAEVVIPGLVSSQLEPELNCVPCHAGDAALAGRSRKVPRFSAADSRMNPKYLETFIRDPHGPKPGTTMPDLVKNRRPIS